MCLKAFFKVFLCVAFACFCILPTNAQNTGSAFDEYNKRITKTFDNYSTNIAKKYSNYLRGIWEKYDAFAPLQCPLDDIVPVRYEGKDTTAIDEIPVEEKNLIIVEERESIPNSPNPVTVEEDNIVEAQTAIPLYNTTVNIRYQNPVVRLDDTDKETLAKAWEQLQEGYFQKTLYDCFEIRRQLNLCDWAYLNLIQKTSSSIFKSEPNKATLLSALLLLQSGYNIRIGRSKDEVCLFFACKQEIYEWAYFDIEGEKFYPYPEITHLDLEEMEICNNPSLSCNAISLVIDKEQGFDAKVSKSRMIQSGTNPEVCVNVTVNENLLEFYSTYPTSRISGNDITKWAMYAQTPVDKTTREPLYEQLSKIISGKDVLDAANILLNFVQTGFVYKFDDEIWGKDRAFFAEESLFYPYCDCEDRSILFSHLIRDLLHLEVALVYSPGHLFTAVNFRENVEGTYLIINNEKFVICEPTCTDGAPVGWSAIENGTEGIKVIVLNKISYE